MSLGAFVAGAAFGGLQYAAAKFQLFERENVVAYAAAQAREQLRPSAKPVKSADERYAALPSREHEYYTYVREGWNSKVFAFRDGVLDLFNTKK